MGKRIIATTIALDGEAEYKKALSSVNSELRTLKGDMRYVSEEFRGQANSLAALTAKHGILQQEVDQQAEKVRSLTQAVADATEAYGENDTRTDRWKQSLSAARTELIRLQRELEETTTYMNEAAESSDGMARSIDGFGNETHDVGGLREILSGLDDGGLDGLTGFLDKLKDLKGVAIGGAVITGIKELGDAAMEVEEATREYRTSMSNLESSSLAAGYSAGQTAEAYRSLYEVLGDSQTTVTTVANLQALHVPQAKLMDLINGCIGAWATYGDSIPIDSLAEAVNETIQAGHVTGSFADVLNWAGKSEDEFNRLLEQQPDILSRAMLVMGEMASQGLPEMAQAWREAHPEITEANASAGRLEEAMGRLGEAVSPLATGFRNLGADIIGGFAGIVDGAIKSVQLLRLALKELFGTIDDKESGKLESLRGELLAPHGTRLHGSHRSGLSYVPFDGYRAELHRGEMVLPAGEAETLRDMRRLGQPSGRDGITAGEMQSIMAASVNALLQQQSTGLPDTITVRLESADGFRLAEFVHPNLRAVERTNPNWRGAP